MIYDRQKEIKDIEIDIDDIIYMLKNVDMTKLTDLEIHDMYMGISRAWLVLSKLV